MCRRKKTELARLLQFSGCFSWFVFSLSSLLTMWLSLQTTRPRTPACASKMYYLLRPHSQLVRGQRQHSEIQNITSPRYTRRGQLSWQKNKKKHVALATLDWNNRWAALGKSSSRIEQILATESMVNFDSIFMFTANKSKRAKTEHILSPPSGGLTENNPHTQTANVRRGTTICAILCSSSQNSFSLLFKFVHNGLSKLPQARCAERWLRCSTPSVHPRWASPNHCLSSGCC